MNKDNHFSNYLIKLIVVWLLLISVNVQRNRYQVVLTDGAPAVTIKFLREIVAADIGDGGVIGGDFTVTAGSFLGLLALNLNLDAAPATKVSLTRPNIDGPPKFAEVTAATNLSILGTLLGNKAIKAGSVTVDAALKDKVNVNFGLALVELTLTGFTPTETDSGPSKEGVSPTVTFQAPTTATADLPFSTFLKGDGTAVFTFSFLKQDGTAITTEPAFTFKQAETDKLNATTLIVPDFLTSTVYSSTGGSGGGGGDNSGGNNIVPDTSQPTLTASNFSDGAKATLTDFSSGIGTYLAEPKMLAYLQSLNLFKCEDRTESTQFTDSFKFNFQLVCNATVKTYFTALATVEATVKEPGKSTTTYKECIDGTKKTVYVAAGTTVVFDNNCTPIYTNNLNDLTSMIGAGNYFSPNAKVTTSNSLAEHPIKLSVILLIATAMYIIA